MIILTIENDNQFTTATAKYQQNTVQATDNQRVGQLNNEQRRQQQDQQHTANPTCITQHNDHFIGEDDNELTTNTTKNQQNTVHPIDDQRVNKPTNAQT